MIDDSQPPILEARGLTKRYGAFAAVRDVNFAIRPRQILGMLGPNGAGKSTIVKIVAGLSEPSSGAVLFKGRRIGDGSTQYKRAAGRQALHASRCIEMRLRGSFRFDVRVA
jgi:ABC-type multidrug transport system ATPase subunit